MLIQCLSSSEDREDLRSEQSGHLLLRRDTLSRRWEASLRRYSIPKKLLCYREIGEGVMKHSLALGKAGKMARFLGSDPPLFD